MLQIAFAERTDRAMNIDVKEETRRIRILVVDDHPIVRRGIIQLIEDEPDLQVCGEADDVQTAVERVRESDPDVVLVDIALKHSNGLELIEVIRQNNPTTPCLVVTMHDEELYGERALRAGARGYIMKQDGDDRIVEAIRAILRQEIYVSEQFKQYMLRAIAPNNRGGFESKVAELSDREFVVFQAMGEGRSSREIATRLRVNIKTVETFRRRIRTKLGIESTTELSRKAVQWNERASSGAYRST
jgi:DNA-binding NarL/FixJ family response regulator